MKTEKKVFDDDLMMFETRFKLSTSTAFRNKKVSKRFINLLDLNNDNSVSKSSRKSLFMTEIFIQVQKMKFKNFMNQFKNFMNRFKKK